MCCSYSCWLMYDAVNRKPYPIKGDHGITTEGEGWSLTVVLLEGINLAAIRLSDPYVVFSCNGKTRSSSIKFQKSDPRWNGYFAEVFDFDAMNEPPSMLDPDVYDFYGPFDGSKSLGTNRRYLWVFLLGLLHIFQCLCPEKSVGMSALLLRLVLIGRASFVFPLSFISNLTKKSMSNKVNLKQQVIIWWAGLMRGVVSMNLLIISIGNDCERNLGISARCQRVGSRYD
ncbi:uncharacterized protein LOC108215303 isoform X4 [Daucus carota subsp. sativus]|uniref:uncharacterized protein LOC108215303 isoform X4 n=1 Tax=Daucus carota subsp. sativus TaxID=79200 RepID=UPI003082B98F